MKTKELFLKLFFHSFVHSQNSHYICSPEREKKDYKIRKIYCGVEQLVARRAHNPKVTGSSPVPATIRKHHYSFNGAFLF